MDSVQEKVSCRDFYEISRAPAPSNRIRDPQATLAR